MEIVIKYLNVADILNKQIQITISSDLITNDIWSIEFLNGVNLIICFFRYYHSGKHQFYFKALRREDRVKINVTYENQDNHDNYLWSHFNPTKAIWLMRMYLWKRWCYTLRNMSYQILLSRSFKHYSAKQIYPLFTSITLI